MEQWAGFGFFAMSIDYRLVTSASQFDEIGEHYRACQRAGKAGAILVAEGKA